MAAPTMNIQNFTCDEAPTKRLCQPQDYLVRRHVTISDWDV
eukprot:CAMPEP_0203748756 /NCGR_PEP_ID=MMETSP0098-20131031/3558_1 /ASSEMBLY_ACC=CAM_ASM_000208 /TAXON_ID=96639 /ORGANISM=" , Strain NY0313808BC1" /LENGTH=40 /DNA_ID= /DNA_START= /DNA_END= /DNA_ORIENTATION=